MLWIIGEKEKIDPVFANDKENLDGNSSLIDQPRDHYEYSYDLKTAFAKWKGELDDDEDIFVVAHSGNDPEPWIGGMSFEQFAKALISKFGAGNLAGRRIWSLTCLTGKHVVGLATLLKDSGVKDVELYMATDYMFVSAAGIPHIITGYDSDEAVNKVVAENASKYGKLKDKGAKPTGDGWLGAKISKDAVTAIGADAARDAVRQRFDLDHTEY